METGKIPPASSFFPSFVPTRQQVRPDGEEKASSRTKEKLPEEGEREKYATNAAKKVNEMVTALNNHLAFSIDEKTGKRIIEIVDSETKEVIRQIPPEEILQVLAGITDMLGSWLDEKV